MIAIIPARGGSKGLPGKNIRELAGKPLIAYTIEAALASTAVSRVIVSTDDKEIAEIAKRYGAEVPFMRPVELATDTANAIDTYNYTIDRLEKESGKSISEFMVLLPTVPLRLAADIDGAHRIFKNKNAESVVSYTRENHPVSWHKYIDDNGKFEPLFEDNQLLNRQKHRETYYPNGAIYIFSRELIRSGKYYSSASYAYIMPGERSVDIDTMEDFELAEFYINRQK